jgi:hypothetical protein
VNLVSDEEKGKRPVIEGGEEPRISNSPAGMGIGAPQKIFNARIGEDVVTESASKMYMANESLPPETVKRYGSESTCVRSKKESGR